MNDVRNEPANLDAYWMPFTPNRRFKADPRMVVRAEGMYYYTADGRAVLDGSAGLWCVNAGHTRPSIVAAIRQMAGELDYGPSFNLAHPLVVRTGQAPRRNHAAGPGPHLLHQLRVRSGGHRAQDRACLPPRPR